MIARHQGEVTRVTGRRPTATVLKLIRGEQRPSRLRNDAPKLRGPPELPPGTKLSENEQQVWDYLLRTTYLEHAHGPSDGPAFLRATRLMARAFEADQKIAEQGLLMRNPRTNQPLLSPHARHSRDLWRQIAQALDAVGGTPAGRFRLAGPRRSGETDDWDAID